MQALLIGAVLGCISSSTLLPVLQQVHLRREVKVTLLVEASFGDAFAVLAVTTLLDLAGGVAAPKAVAWALGSSLILAVACGVLAGMLWSYLLPVLSDERFWHVLTFAAVLLVYSGVHFLRGDDFVAVLVFGLTLTNFPTVRKRLHFDDTAGSDWFNEMPVQGQGGKSLDLHHDQMLTFHGELAFLLRTFFSCCWECWRITPVSKKSHSGWIVLRRDFCGARNCGASRTPRMARIFGVGA